MGFGTGLALNSFWVLLLVPVVFVLAVELMRLRVDGPAVDKPVFTEYGTFAFVSGRGVQALLSLYPVMLGCAYGVIAARHLSPRKQHDQEEASDRLRRKPWARWTGHIIIGLCAIGMLVLIAMLLVPASTSAITDSDGNTVSGSVAELTSVNVNGKDLALMIRGYDSVNNPILLFLAGGPGGSELGAMRNHLARLEEHFTVVTWDQRGCGKSYVELDPTNTVSPEGYIADTLVVTDYLRDRFGQDRIYLLGQSWGTLLAVLVVRTFPDRYRAMIGTGQMVNTLETDQLIYNDTLAWARSTGRTGLADKLKSIGPPPYGSMLNYEMALTYEHEVYPYDHSANSEGEGGFSENLGVREYNFIERIHLIAAFLDTFAALYPLIQDVDFRQDAGNNQYATTDFEVPVFFVQGAHEANGRAKIFQDWYPTISAPVKDLVILNTSGHRPLFEQPDAFIDYMVNTVLNSTQ